VVGAPRFNASSARLTFSFEAALTVTNANNIKAGYDLNSSRMRVQFFAVV
jgi:hypothetical protein